MKFLSALAAGLFATAVTSLAIPDPEAVPEALPEADPEAVPAAFASLTDVQIIKYTVKDWYADTAIVSKFLDNIAKKNFRSDAEFTKAAKLAWLAEYSSTAPTWGNKAVLDSYLAGKNGSNGSNGTEQSNGTWTGEGSYGQNVKDRLEELKNKKWRRDCKTIQQIAQEINDDRCEYVLPAIDGYFQQASNLVASYNPSKPDYSIRSIRAVRAKACGATRYARDVEDELVMDLEE
ncbi:hypothetical protein CKM354_000818500 [Cercospora kikuchii]|uniref:Uncharacterized protein n=1 Tax=Cercospora kikuchii TaxID=84275 RepID=A0A9P3FF23_9PEZI|nr:uncharacterized protein CKM354_000818500 [Cercospora kikuchii]GIZ45001.1 hypothetical protein CKM354_000818500 [Cercospora kikuchii]